MNCFFSLRLQLTQVPRFLPEKGGIVLSSNLGPFEPQSHALLIAPLQLENQYFGPSEESPPPPKWPSE